MPSRNDAHFPDFSTFIDSVNSAGHEPFTAAHPTSPVGAEEFDAMRAHIQSLYRGIEDVPHSFVDDNGQVFDCVPVERQPALRGTTSAPAAPADAPAGPGPRVTPQSLPLLPQLRSDRIDKFGHAMSCPPGTIALRRVTLDELARRGTLRDFFRKSPLGTGRHPRLGPQIQSGVHKYAHAYQVTDNLGGHSFINVWDPGIGGQVFSLSQHWYAAGSPVQTAECGYQIYPGKYGTTQPCLFIYWTADGYQHTGCYNLDCSAFVQTNSAWAFGGTLAPVSVSGGAQYELEVAWYFNGGNWWLYLGGTDAGHAVGYYPGSLYGSGPLASGAAADIDYGGEVVDNTAWPAMGSGAFAEAGWQFAAYHRDVYYYPASGGAVQASLTASQPSPNCFTSVVNQAADPWNEYFFYGGPGGTGCS
ncbi:neprosin family prolyl endopeptidase [Streptomyces sp. NPDC051162]|uniref:neprosin family prolyl endopeptidase n=1 Tax=unclassified Streptomyces TaxID=2593676 RepID=UPI00341BCBF4